MDSMNTVLENPRERAAYLYHTAKSALADMLDSSDRPWEDALVLLRQMAERRRATVIGDALEATRNTLNRAALQQDIADRWTGRPAPEDAFIDRTIESDFAEGRL